MNKIFLLYFCKLDINSIATYVFVLSLFAFFPPKNRKSGSSNEFNSEMSFSDNCVDKYDGRKMISSSNSAITDLPYNPFDSRTQTILWYPCVSFTKPLYGLLESKSVCWFNLFNTLILHCTTCTCNQMTTSKATVDQKQSLTSFIPSITCQRFIFNPNLFLRI